MRGNPSYMDSLQKQADQPPAGRLYQTFGISERDLVSVELESRPYSHQEEKT